MFLAPARPRHAAEATYNLVSWTELPRGGHFGALEVPDLFAAEIRTFFGRLRAQGINAA